MLRHIEARRTFINVNFNLFFKQNFGSPQLFTLDQFLLDAQDNVNHLSPGLSKRWGIEFKSMLIDSSTTNTCSMLTTDKQAVIVLNKQLLRDCYKSLNEPVRSYYKRNSHSLNVDEELFARLAMGASMLMAFWHEVAHIVRGHVTYNQKLIDKAANGEAPTGDRIPQRVSEIDADIYGGQFLLAQLSVVMRATPDISIATYAQCYAIGVRCLYESLQGPYGKHDEAPGSDHPSPINRAYTAYTHGIARASEMAFKAVEHDALLTIGSKALLEFETLDLGFRIDPDALTNFSQTDLELWRSREKEFFPYQFK